MLFKICLSLIALTFNTTLSALEVNEKAVNGGIKILTISAPEAPEAYFYNKRVLVEETSDNTYRAIVGIPITASAGTHTLNLPGFTPSSAQFVIDEGKYNKQYITLTGEKKKYVDIPAATIKRITKEAKLLSQAKNIWTPHLQATTLQMPATGVITGVFGSQRFFNNKPRKPHSGVDIANNKGTEIHSIGAGTVILTGNFYFNGNTVVIDHGQGFVSMYIHLDSIAVSQGDKVTLKESIGTMGQSGRATGVHLHLSTYLNGVAVDPQLLLHYEQ